MPEPAQKPHRSVQDYKTPAEFMDAVRGRFGPLAWDLAAHEGNAQCEQFIGPDQDTFAQSWSKLAPGQWLWLNPPFGDIESFVRKAAVECELGARVLMLLPASVGTVWFRQYVLRRSMVLALSPRMSFDGQHLYPKDLMLLVYSHGMHGFDQWQWRAPKQRSRKVVSLHGQTDLPTTGETTT